jgi:hypothetical protein
MSIVDGGSVRCVAFVVTLDHVVFDDGLAVAIHFC